MLYTGCSVRPQQEQCSAGINWSVVGGHSDLHPATVSTLSRCQGHNPTYLRDKSQLIPIFMALIRGITPLVFVTILGGTLQEQMQFTEKKLQACTYLSSVRQLRLKSGSTYYITKTCPCNIQSFFVL